MLDTAIVIPRSASTVTTAIGIEAAVATNALPSVSTCKTPTSAPSGIAQYQAGITAIATVCATRPSARRPKTKPNAECTTSQPRSFQVCGSPAVRPSRAKKSSPRWSR